MTRISRRLGLIFLSFFLLVVITAGGMTWELRAHASDALAINLAGRQRMLIQWMTRLAVEPQYSPTDQEALDAAARAFEETLQAFQHGGAVHYPADQTVMLPAAGDAAIQAQLGSLESEWLRFRSTLDTARSTPPGSQANHEARAAVKALSPALVANADLMARLFQAAADRRTAALAWAQAGFFAAASLLLLVGVWASRRSILRPLNMLKEAAARIGGGDLKTPVRADGPLEMAELAAAFDAMRGDLLAARQELLRWNQTLEGRVDERTRELEALYEVIREVSSRLEPEAVFRSVTDKARMLLGADTAFLCLLDDSQRFLNLRAHSGPEISVLESGVETGNAFVGAILGRRAAQRCAYGEDCEGCGMIEAQFRRSHLAAPLWVDQRRIGVLCVGHRSEAAFPADAARLLERLAGIAAVAIENARLYRLAERTSALEERQRIAAAIHDGLAQTIDSVGLWVDQACDRLDNGDYAAAERALGQAYERNRRASSEARQSIASLDGEPPAQASLQERLSALLAQARSEAAPGQVWQTSLPGALFLPETDAQNVLGIVREALNNARRHARASRICLELALKGDLAELKIEDDGCGFDPASLPDDGWRHFGMKILQARAAQLGGQLRIDSKRGVGTCVTLTWRLQAQPPAIEW